MISDAFELYERLSRLELLSEKPPLWWPAYGSFEVMVGAVLTQNAQWTRVETSLENIRSYRLMDPQALAEADYETVMELVRPSGLHKAKAKNLMLLSQALLEAFGDFEHFCAEVERDWLLAQRGIGPETADSILCYACKRAVMVVDAYTHRLLAALGVEYEAYDDLQGFFTSIMPGHFSEEQLSEIYALYHGMIVEYVKRNSRRKTVDVSRLFEDV